MCDGAGMVLFRLSSRNPRKSSYAVATTFLILETHAAMGLHAQGGEGGGRELEPLRGCIGCFNSRKSSRTNLQSMLFRMILVITFQALHLHILVE